MKFLNAADGVKKIFTAEILSLFATIFLVIATLFGVVTVAGISVDSADGFFVSVAGAAVFGLASVVLFVIAYILNLVGVNKAAKDEPAFKIALYAIIIGLIITVVSSFLPSNASFRNVIQIISDIANLVITLYVVQGIRNLAVKLDNSEMDKKGESIFKVMICIYALIIIAKVITAIVSNNVTVTISLVLIIIAGILNVVQYILYLIYLNKAKKMLAE